MRSSHAVRQLVAVRAFRQLLAVRLSGQCGDGLFQGALFGAAFFNPEKATSAGAAALAFAVLLLPYSAVGPFAGVLLDRWSRQQVLLVSNALRAALAVVLAVSLAGTGATSAPTLGIALAVVSLNRFVLSGLSAALPRVVDRERLVSANALTTTLGTAATTVGAVASLGLRALWGTDDGAAGQIALAAALLYAGSAVLASRIGRRRLGPEGADPVVAVADALAEVLRGLSGGVRHLISRRRAALALLAMTSHRFCSGLVFVMVLLLYTEAGYLGGGLGHLGQVVGASVAGGLVAAAVTPRVVNRVGAPRWIVAALATAAAVTAGLLPTYAHGALVVAGAALGFAAQAAKICVDTLLQASVDDSFRGRVFSVYDTLFNVSFVGAAALAALLVPDDGHAPGVVGLVAAGYALTAVAYALLAGTVGRRVSRAGGP